MDKTTRDHYELAKEYAESLGLNDSDHFTIVVNDFVAGYLKAIEECNVKQLQEENERLREALQKVSDWDLPQTGHFWDADKKEPMSYAAAYGTNGVRDYFRQIAQKALTK